MAYSMDKVAGSLARSPSANEWLGGLEQSNNELLISHGTHLLCSATFTFRPHVRRFGKSRPS